jgi:hypothetical protein
MAVTSKVLARTAAATTSTTLYTVPSATTAIITNLVVVNTTNAVQNFTINFDGVAFASSFVIANNSLATFDIKQVLDATKTITASASTTGVNFHISGVEVA